MINTPANTVKNPKQFIEQLLLSGLPDMAEKEIRRHKLDLRIVSDGVDKNTGQPVYKIIDESPTTENWLEKFITQDVHLLKVKQEVLKLAKEQVDVLLCGETGTGKELIAHALHGEREDDLLAINCAGLPDELVESELFGHKKGSFTGAIVDKEGLMIDAGRGTLFMDEVGELPLASQSKLLRALQSREVRAVGGTVHRKVYCRFVFATNRNLEDMIEKGLFRKDLYARISTIPLTLTELKDRKEDIPLILEKMDGGIEFMNAMKQIPNKMIEDIETPYNVRSLQQYVTRYKLLGRLPV